MGIIVIQDNEKPRLSTRCSFNHQFSSLTRTKTSCSKRKTNRHYSEKETRLRTDPPPIHQTWRTHRDENLDRIFCQKFGEQNDTTSHDWTTKSESCFTTYNLTQYYVIDISLWNSHRLCRQTEITVHQIDLTFSSATSVLNPFEVIDCTGFYVIFSMVDMVDITASIQRICSYLSPKTNSTTWSWTIQITWSSQQRRSRLTT